MFGPFFYMAGTTGQNALMAGMAAQAIQLGPLHRMYRNLLLGGGFQQGAQARIVAAVLHPESLDTGGIVA